MTENDETMSLHSGVQECEQLKDDLAKVTHERNLLRTQLSVLTDENDTLQATSKKWLKRLDEEIETNQQNVISLSQQIKQLKETNRKLEFRLQNQETQAHVQSQLSEKQSLIKDLEKTRLL